MECADEVHRALRVRAARHGRSAEAEIRDILERAVKPAKRVRLGDALAALGRKAIRRRKAATGVTRSDSEHRVVASSIGVERQHAIAEQLEQAVECARQGVPAPACR